MINVIVSKIIIPILLLILSVWLLLNTSFFMFLHRMGPTSNTNRNNAHFFFFLVIRVWISLSTFLYYRTIFLTLWISKTYEWVLVMIHQIIRIIISIFILADIFTYLPYSRWTNLITVYTFHWELTHSHITYHNGFRLVICRILVAHWIKEYVIHSIEWDCSCLGCFYAISIAIIISIMYMMFFYHRLYISTTDSL